MTDEMTRFIQDNVSKIACEIEQEDGYEDIMVNMIYDLFVGTPYFQYAKDNLDEVTAFIKRMTP